MARYSLIRLGSLDDLARQLRFTPKPAAVRQVTAVLALADQVDPARAYAEDWVLRRITGYRREMSEPAMLVGAALLGDLSALAERLSAQARLAQSDFGDRFLTLDALRQRWGVSARSIERYRRLGLIGLRLVSGVRGQRLVFPSGRVEAFESRHAAMLGRTKRTPRRGPGEETRSAASPRLARPGSARRAARVALRAWRLGIGASEIASRLGVTRASAHRLINEERARLLRGLDLAGPGLPDHGADAEGQHLSPAVVREGLGGAGDTDAASLAESALRRAAPDAARERLLGAAFALLRAGAAQAISRLGSSPGGASLDTIETRLRWAGLLKIELVRGERSLIVRSIEERAGSPLTAVPPLKIRHWTAVAFRAAGDGVDRFDPFKRGRLATPVSLALARALAGLSPKRPASSRRDEVGSAPLDDWCFEVLKGQDWLHPPRATLGALRQSLIVGGAANVLRLRFGLGVGPPLTLESLAREHGISPGTVWRALAASRRAGRVR